MAVDVGTGFGGAIASREFWRPQKQEKEVVSSEQLSLLLQRVIICLLTKNECFLDHLLAQVNLPIHLF